MSKSAFSEKTHRQLARLGFTDIRPSEYFENCMVIRDDSGGFYGHFTDAEARAKLLGEKKSRDQRQP